MKEACGSSVLVAMLVCVVCSCRRERCRQNEWAHVSAQLYVLLAAWCHGERRLPRA